MRWSTVIALVFGLGMAGPALAQNDEGVFEDENGVFDQDNGVFEDESDVLDEEDGGVLEDDDADVVNGGLGEGEESRSGFASDEFGLFDPDYDWEAADDDEFNDWYGEADDDWLNDDWW